MNTPETTNDSLCKFNESLSYLYLMPIVELQQPIGRAMFPLGSPPIAALVKMSV